MLTSNTSITPRYVTDFRTTGTPMLLLHEAERVLGVVTYDGLRFLDTVSLAPIGGLNLPRGILPIVLPNDSRTLGYALSFDDSTRTLLVLENEGQLHSYHGGPCLRSTLSAVPVDGGATRVGRSGGHLRAAAVRFGAQRLHDSGATAARPARHGDPTAGPIDRCRRTGMDVIAGHRHVVLEAGTAPGAANLLRQAVTGTTPARRSNVPPGTYYVRLRAVGVAGDAISTEVLVRF